MTWLIASVVVLGASAVDDLDLAETEQAGGRFSDDPGDACPSCGGNGFTEDGYNYMFGQYTRNTLNDAGVNAWANDNPISLCTPGTNNGSSCDLRWNYSEWLRRGLVNKRVHIFTEVVRVVAPQGFAVRDRYTSGNTYYGKFGIARAALDGHSYATTETISAGLLALLNPVAGVPICLTSRHYPSGCADSGAHWHESNTFGNHFRAAYVAIGGGQHAVDPHQNKRFGNVTNSTAMEVVTYGSASCDLNSSGTGRYAIRCRSGSNVTWQNPVTVLTPFVPDDFYYGPGPITRKDVPWTDPYVL
jgi:hypothetical protein